MNVSIICDRCNNLIQGIEDEFCTGGFYKQSWMPDIFKENEYRICDKCMWSDPIYIAIYGEKQ